MRIGFFIGFVAAALAASFKRTKRVEAPSTESDLTSATEKVEAGAEQARAKAQGFLDDLKSAWHEAVEAGKQAAREKEEELEREFEASKNGNRRQPPTMGRYIP